MHFVIKCGYLRESRNVEHNENGAPYQDGHEGIWLPLSRQPWGQLAFPPKTAMRAVVWMLLFTHVFWHSLLGNEMRWVEMLVTKLWSWRFSSISGSSFLDSKCLENELLKCESGLCIENCKTGRGWLAACFIREAIFSLRSLPLFLEI